MKIDLKKEMSLPKLSLPSRRARPKSINGGVGGRSRSLRGPSLSRPSWLRMPELPSMPSRRSAARGSRPGGSKLPSPPKTNIKAPKFLVDIYADLRDRRLLPLVAVLIVAIIAAPILLKDKGEEEPAAAPITGTSTAPGSDASFAVVPAEPGLRDYRKRLGSNTARNPFKQPAANGSGGESSSGAAEGGGEEATTGGTGPSEEVSTTVTESTSSSGSEPSGGGGGSPEASSESGTEGGGSTESTGTEPANESAPAATKESTTSVVVEKTVSGYSLDAKFGFVGHLKSQTGLPEMTKLPDPKQPILVYLGPSKENKGALFLLGSLVSAYYGQGKCTLDKQSCTVLELRPGKSATLVYGIEQQRFKITLEQIQPIVETNEEASTVTKHAH